jgi:hypothetical protein
MAVDVDAAHVVGLLKVWDRLRLVTVHTHLDADRAS